MRVAWVENSKAQWVPDDGKASLSGRKNDIILQSAPADVIFETEVLCLFEFIEKTIDFIFGHLLIGV